MKKITCILMAAVALLCSACNENAPEPFKGEVVANPELPGDSTKILVAYFSWGGTTQRMAEHIATLSGADCSVSNPRHPTPPSIHRLQRSPKPSWKPTHALPSRRR